MYWSLYDHPEGVDEFSQDTDGSRSVCSIQTCNQFVEVSPSVDIWHASFLNFWTYSSLAKLVMSFSCTLSCHTLHPRIICAFLASSQIHPLPWRHLSTWTGRIRKNTYAHLLYQSDISSSIAFEQSLVEQKILNTLGVESLSDWKITGARRRYTPRTRAGKDSMIIQEVERLKAHALRTGGVVDSMHINGPVSYQVIVGWRDDIGPFEISINVFLYKIFVEMSMYVPSVTDHTSSSLLSRDNTSGIVGWDEPSTTGAEKAFMVHEMRSFDRETWKEGRRMARMTSARCCEPDSNNESVIMH